MGLFDFLKDAGANIFKTQGNEAADITNLLNKNFEGQISELRVDFYQGVVTLFGKADTQATKEKAVLLAGNLRGVEKVNDENLLAPPAEEKTEFYTVQRGDTLSKIAKRYYGNGAKYPVIFEANKEVIKNPDLIYPGQTLRIPKIGE